MRLSLNILVQAGFPLITHFNKFSIHKAYYISEQKTKRVDVYSLFVREYLQIYGGNETNQKSSFLKRLKNYL